jgi:hypothetical protein
VSARRQRKKGAQGGITRREHKAGAQGGSARQDCKVGAQGGSARPIKQLHYVVVYCIVQLLYTYIDIAIPIRVDELGNSNNSLLP